MSCQNFSNQRNFLFDVFNAINSEILKMSENKIPRVLLFGYKSFTKDALCEKYPNTGKYRPEKKFNSLKTVKNLMNHFLLEKNLFDICSRQ